MKSGTIITAFILATTLLSQGIAQADEILIIAHENVPTSALTKDDIKQIFLGKKTTWENDEKIIFVVQCISETRDSFLRTYILKSAYQYDIYWKKQIFTGKGQAPRSFSSDQEVALFVTETPGAIGYVASGAAIGKAKIIPIH